MGNRQSGRWTHGVAQIFARTSEAASRSMAIGSQSSASATCSSAARIGFPHPIKDGLAKPDCWDCASPDAATRSRKRVRAGIHYRISYA